MIVPARYVHSVGQQSRTFDVAPDGRRFLMIKQADEGQAAPQTLIVVQGWFEELKRLVPGQ